MHVDLFVEYLYAQVTLNSINIALPDITNVLCQVHVKNKVKEVMRPRPARVFIPGYPLMKFTLFLKASKNRPAVKSLWQICTGLKGC